MSSIFTVPLATLVLFQRIVCPDTPCHVSPPFGERRVIVGAPVFVEPPTVIVTAPSSTRASPIPNSFAVYTPGALYVCGLLSRQSPSPPGKQPGIGKVFPSPKSTRKLSYLPIVTSG